MKKHLHIDAANGLSGDMLLGGMLDAGLDLDVLQDGLKKLPLEKFSLDRIKVLRGGITATRLMIDEGHGFPPEPAAGPTHTHHDHMHDKHEHSHDDEHKHSHHGHPHKSKKTKGKKKSGKHAHDHKHDHDHEDHGHSHEHTEHSHSHDHAGPARTLPDVLKLLEKGKISDSVKEMSEKIFRRIAEAEAAIHGKKTDEVHFHEISGLDSIIDIVGFAIGWEALGISSASSSAVTVGSGFVNCAHGRLPLPAPATAELLKGIPLLQEDAGCELCTPTGAAIVTGLCSQFGPFPAMNIASIGYGAGARDFANRSNTVRLLIGEIASAQENSECDRVLQLTCAIDDMTGEALGFVSERLFAAGALDVYYAHLVMKKSRPGVELNVIIRPQDRKKITDLIFADTSTFGLRVQEIEREILEREHINVEIGGRPVRIKAGKRHGRVVTLAPEFDDCKQAAEQDNDQLMAIYERAKERERKERGKN